MLLISDKLGNNSPRPVYLFNALPLDKGPVVPRSSDRVSYHLFLISVEESMTVLLEVAEKNIRKIPARI